MRKAGIGLAALIAGYGLSQFYRAFMAVLTPILQTDLGVGPGDLAIASGLWFLAFAAVQLPIGWALDSVGPGRTSGWMLAIGGGLGAAIFSAATEAWHLEVAMTLLGAGCAPILMAAYYLLAREWPVSAFGAMAGMVVGVGSLGDILGAAPLVRVIEAFGWRETLRGLAAVTFAVGVLITLMVRTPPEPDGPRQKASFGALMRVRDIWPMVPLIFAGYVNSVAIRGLWAAPFLQTMHAGDARMIGRATLAMGVATVAGNLLSGRLVRLFGTPRRASIACTSAAIAALTLLALWPSAPMPVIYVALAALGFCGTNYALLMAHGRSFMPPHLIGRGITFLNMFSLAGVGILQFGSRPIYKWALEAHGPAAAISAVFLFFLVPLVIGFGIYLTTRESPDVRTA